MWHLWSTAWHRTDQASVAITLHTFLCGQYTFQISAETPPNLTENFRGFPQSLAHTGIVPLISHGHFLPYPSKYIFHQPTTLCNRRQWKHLETNHKETAAENFFRGSPPDHQSTNVQYPHVTVAAVCHRSGKPDENSAFVGIAIKNNATCLRHTSREKQHSF